MMWLYIQTDGALYRMVEGLPHNLEATGGYSGYLSGQNDPVANCDKDFGPIPRGFYHIHEPRDIPLPNGKKLVYALPLLPFPENDMCDPPRDNFLIHGEKEYEPHQARRTASAGCIIFPRSIRTQVWESGDHQLRVSDFLVYP